MTGSGAAQQGSAHGDGTTTPGQADWWALVDKTLKGASRDSLYSTTADDIRVAPVYGPGAHDFAVPGGGAAAVSRPLVAEISAVAVARAIRTECEGGTRQIALSLAAPGQPGLQWKPGTLARALEGVDFNAIEIHLRPGLDSAGAGRELLSLIEQKATRDARFGLGADPIGAAASAGTKPCRQTLDDLASRAVPMAQRSGATVFLASGVTCHEAGGSQAQELAFALAGAVSYLRAMEAAGMAPTDASTLIAFEHAADADIFLTIAKFRACRLLWGQILQGCGAPEAADTTPMEARISARMLCTNDAYVNMIRATAASLGASVGGAAAVTVLPFTHPLGQPDDLARRIARNTAVILAEESQIGAVRDAAAGAYYVESLTRDLAARAWEIFREIEVAGGMAAMLGTGEFQRRVASVRAAREARIARGEKRLTGVNIYPHLDEPRPETRPWPAPDGVADGIVPLSPIRLDKPFAELRRLSNEFLEKTGARPTVFFANLGDASDFAARSAWCAELLTCGGIKAVSGAGFATIEAAVAAYETAGTPIVCISASDAFYSEHAVETARALTQAGAEFVALVGNVDTGCLAGVDALVYPGCDGLAFLTRLHDIVRSGS